MAVQKNQVQGFVQSWDKTAAWAQSQGITKKDYYPIYQMDSKRLLAGETPMSTSERTRAILAANNPNNVTPVPGDHPDPTNIMGNTVNDLKNIFTGLAPNHLVSNIFGTIKNTVLHPSTVIKPIADVVGGVTSGNVNQVKQGLELAAGLQGPGSILSWLPGVYVAGEFAQGGVSNVLSHPVVSFLDVAPGMPAGKLIAAGADASRVAEIADRLGTTPEQLVSKSIPSMAKAYAMNSRVASLPNFISDRAPSLVDLKTGKPMTIGSAVDRWITQHTGLGKTLSSIMKGMLEINQHQTDAEVALFAPAQASLQALKTDEERNQVFRALEPDFKGSAADVRAEETLSPAVRTAIELNREPLNFIKEANVSSGATVPVHRLDGTIALIHTAGENSPVVDVAKEFNVARDELVTAMGPSHRLSAESHQLDLQGDELQTKIDRTAQVAERDVANLHGKERYANFPTEIGAKRPKMVTLDLRRQAVDLFGRGPDSRAEGMVYQVEQAMQERDWATVKVLSAGVLRRLSKSGVGSLDASLSDSLTVLKGQMELAHNWATKRIEYDRRFLKEFEKDGKFGSVRGPLNKYLRAEAKFTRTVWDHPSGDWVDVAKQQFIENLLKQEDSYHRMEDFSKALRDRGVAQERIDRLHKDPTKFAQLMVLSIRALGNAPFGEPILRPAEEQAMWRSAIDAANKLRQSGHEVQWLPRITSLDIRDTDPGRYGIHVASSGKARKSTRAFARKMDITAERKDVVAALHQAGKEALQIEGTIEYAETVLTPHLAQGTKLLDMLTGKEADATGLGDVYERYLAQGSNPTDALERIMNENFKMVRFEPDKLFGISLPRWTADPNGTFIPKEIADALPKMLDRGQFPLQGAYQKATGLFRFSILKMSPRYTAHVLFGGTFLLALRSSPQLLRSIPEAWNIMRHQGEVPRSIFERTAPQFGIDPVQYVTDADLHRVAKQKYHEKGGAQMAKMLSEEHIVEKQKTPLSEAKPVHWLKAVGEVNYKFTNWASAFQRSAAYVDFLNSNAKRFRDPETGETMAMTKDRAHVEAMKHVNKVMGDLQSMSPLERSVFTTVMPFYGWTRHILGYVMTYPEDHPFRAAALAVMATQNSDSVASGLPKRLQFLFFLGSPDAQGNVSAVDVRALDPLRDVANYATLGGWISSLNPVITAPLAMIDPQIIFGGNPLYPNVTYDQFYGIETAGSQGSPLTAVEQFVPQITALQAALAQSGQFKQLAATNPNAFAKTIFTALNIPFAQVQHINLKQIAAKGELDRYHVASTAAQNAFKTGDFSAIEGLSSVPDPLNQQYEVSPDYLKNLYAQLLAQYPGQPPAQTAIPPPSPSL